MFSWFYKEFHRPIDYKLERLMWFWICFSITGVVLIPLWWLINAYPLGYFVALILVVFYGFFLKEPEDSIHRAEEWWRGNIPVWKFWAGGWRRELRLRGGK